MRTTAGSTALSPRAEATGTTRRRSADTPARQVGGVTRPSMASVPGREKKSGSAVIGKGGWAGYKKAKAERSTRYLTLDVAEDKSVVIKFVEAEPFAFAYRHWPKGGRPDFCLNDPENDVECPLDAVDKPKPVVYYNVITVDDATLRVWEMTSEPTRQVQKHYDKLAEQEKTLDDPGLYFVVSKSKKDNGFFEYDVEKVRESDLKDETGIDPMDADEIADATKKGLFDDSILYIRSLSDLREVADKLS